MTMWHTDQPKEGILTVTIDRTDRPVNSLDQKALDELSQLLEKVRVDSSIKGMLFLSGKPGNFIAGADVTEISQMSGKLAASAMSRQGQKVFYELEKFPKPTVALISGACLGGGLEFALACSYRVVSDHPKTLLGLPEVKLGLVPGWGGTVRLPRRIGLIPALPMILTGKTLNGYQAKKIGLVTDVVPVEALPSVGRQVMELALSQDASQAKLRKHLHPLTGPWWKRKLSHIGFIQNLALNMAEKKTQKATQGHYPAPMKAIEVLRAGRISDRAGYEAEIETIGELAEHPVTRELMRLFFLQEGAKKPPKTLPMTVPPDSISQGAIIGAGKMGAGMAMLMARKGIRTRLKDLTPDMVAQGMGTVRKLLKKDRQRRRISALEERNTLDRLSPTTDDRGLKHADIIIEAVVENLEVKQKVFRDLAAVSGPDTVLATNTSSLKVTDIAEALDCPERMVGVHFFNPPEKMPLVEVVRTEKTSPEALATAAALVQRLGKTMVIVGDCPGFLVNRLLTPYMNEAGYLLTEVQDPMEIERAAKNFGMPMGPLELIDLVGLEVAAHVARNMHDAYGSRMKPSPVWDVLVDSAAGGKTKLIHNGRFNRRVAKRINVLKSSKGSPPVPQEQIIERLIYPIINEAARCLAEGIAASPDDIDLAMVFGTGFAPFRGGPLRYAESVGLPKIVEALEYLSADHPRMAPSEPLRRYASGGAELVMPYQPGQYGEISSEPEPASAQERGS